MHRFPSPRLALVAALCVLGANAASLHRPQCSQTLSHASSIADELQSKYWNGFSYNGGELWTDANTLEDLHNLMIAANNDDYSDIADYSYIGLAALNPDTNWASFFEGSYDDAQWVILALWKISEYKTSRCLDDSMYMSSSLAIYDMVAAEWDDTCGGGVWWSSDHTYKNAITNQLFLLTSAEAYLRTGNGTYLQNAEKEYEWLLKSGMRGPDGLFNDGLDLNTCQNNGQTAWTYNQAVVASGLAALYAATGSNNPKLLQQAQLSLQATMHSSLTYDGVLKESCDDAHAAVPVCDKDQQLFKGVWTKHVQYFLDKANDASITAQYANYLWSQYAAIEHNALDAAGDVGSVWYAQNGSQWGPQASASGLEAAISAANYAPCKSL